MCIRDSLYSDTRIVLCVDGLENEYEAKLAERYSAPYARLCKAAEKNGAAVMYVCDEDNDWGKPVDVLLVKAATYKALAAWIDNVAAALAKGSALTFEAVLAGELGEADDYGVALINTGNIACSVEKGGMLNLKMCIRDRSRTARTRRDGNPRRSEQV